MTEALFGPVATAMACSWLTTKLLIPILQRKGVMDVPNLRSSHSIPTPRAGGVGILLGVAAGLFVSMAAGGTRPPFPFVVALLAIASCGLLDDVVKHVPVTVRLFVQFLAAGLVVTSVGPILVLPLPHPVDISLGLLAWPLSLIWIVAVMNIYNFLDGIDGFAGFQGVIAGAAVVAMGFDRSSILFGAVTAAACLGFLVHNWHPARIFMGDVGSTTLGFVFATLPFQMKPAQRPAAVFCLAMCLWFFLADGGFTLLNRSLKRKRVWEAHRSHLYQQLQTILGRHDLVVIRVGGLAMPLCGLTVVAARWGDPLGYWIVLIAAVLGFLIYRSWVGQTGKTSFAQLRTVLLKYRHVRTLSESQR